MRELELLAPAANVEVAREAILHGADAVYIGASSHGARKSAANSVEDIRSLVAFAHRYRSRVYVTVNTLVYESELQSVCDLVWQLWHAGVDALIVQDMALLRMKLPPIALHASTQCDTRTPGKARFLQDVGFSQIVLARELTLEEIRAITSEVSVPVECFIHGALCVSYSGRCHASQSSCGRSANRGECAQICRLPYTLTDASGKILARNRHLLSLKDFNLSDRMADLVEAGVSSFKIEGRLKDAAYVKNVTAAYRRILDDIIAANPGKYRRSSAGRSEISFSPVLAKSFNRGFTHYFLDERRPKGISSPLTPKSMGQPVRIADLNNGDGVSYFNEKGEYVGVNINKVENGRIFAAGGVKIPKGTELHRTFDREWQNLLSRPTAKRVIAVDMTIDSSGLSAIDERGCSVRVPLDVVTDVARRPMDPRPVLSKLGNTIYYLRQLDNNLPETLFIPASGLTQLRNRLIEALDIAAEATYVFDRRRPESPDACYPVSSLDYQDNVANSLADAFYRSHGVKEIAPAMETEGILYGAAGKAGEVSDKNDKKEVKKGLRSVMTTRHCILREMGLCRKEGHRLNEPLTLSSGNRSFRLSFDCERCEMHLLH